MSVNVRVQNWLSKIQYDGSLPTDLSKICKPRTAFIWEQFISNVQHRQEVEYIKKNIILNRLEDKFLENTDKYSYPIRELDVFVEKTNKEAKLEYLESQLLKKEQEIDYLLTRNKENYIKIDHFKAKIRENREKKFVLEKKGKLVDIDIQNYQECFTLVKSLTPVEAEESQSNDEILNTLKKCVDKLEKLPKEVFVSDSNNLRTFHSSADYSLKKPFSHDRLPSKHSNLNNSVIFREMNKNINNRQKNNLIPEIHELEENEDFKKMQNESFGVLSNSFLINSDDLDNLLLSPSSSKICKSHYWEHSSEDSENKFITRCYSDDHIKAVLQQLMYKSCRSFIITQWEYIFQELILKKSAIQYKMKSIQETHSRNDWSNLYFHHIKNELEFEKYSKYLNQLVGSMNIKKDEILLECSKKTHNFEESRRHLEAQMEDAFVKGASTFLMRWNHNAKKIENKSEIEEVEAKIKKINEFIISKSQNLPILISNAFKVIKDLKTHNKEFDTYLNKQHRYINNSSSFQPLISELNTKELELFERFPLEFNRDEIHSDSTIPPFLELKTDDLRNLNRILNLPFSSPENVIYNALKAKTAINKLEKLDNQISLPNKCLNKYTAREVNESDSAFKATFQQMDSTIRSISVTSFAENANLLKDNINLWLEMPYRNYISEGRQVNGKCYQYYEQLLDELIE